MISFYHLAVTFAIAAAPIIERAALPVALKSFDLPLWLAFPLVVVGNAVPAAIIIFAFDPVMRWLGRYLPPVHRFTHRALARARAKVHPWVEKYGILGLIFIVALPTPITGVYTGAGAAALLGMEKRTAFVGVVVGAIIANLIIGATLGLFNTLTN